MDGLVVCIVCSKDDCPRKCKPLIYCGLDLGEWIITQAAPLIAHLIQYHKYSNNLQLTQSGIAKQLPLNNLCMSIFTLIRRDGYYERIPVKDSYIWISKELEISLRNIMLESAGIKLQFTEENNLELNEVAFALSHFLALKRNHDCNIKSKITISSLILGQDIVSVSTPFACVSMYNSWFKGTICNKINNYLALAELRMTDNCEGAPVFSFENGKKQSLVGLIICNIEFKNSGYTGYSFLASPEVLCHDFGFEFEKISKQHQLNVVQKNVKSVVRVIVDCNWGSGIVISEDGLILTSSHLIYFGHKINDIKIIIEDEYYSAKVLFYTDKTKSCELALLQMDLNVEDSPVLVPAVLSNHTPKVGDAVNAVGFSLLFHNTFPFVSNGIISEISDHIMSSSCIFHRGASGGALFNLTGQLIGMLSGVVSTTDGLTVYPHINCIIPCHSFGKSLSEFISKRDINPLIKWRSSVPCDAAKFHFQICIKERKPLFYSKL